MSRPITLQIFFIRVQGLGFHTGWVERRPSRLAEKADRVEWRAANNILTVWSISREFGARTLTVAAREQRGFL